MSERTTKKHERDAYSVAEVAQRLGCSVSHTWNMVRAGELATFKFGARVFVARRELERLLNGKTD